VVDYFVSRVDGVALSCVQFFTVGVISGALMIIFERDTLSFQNVFSATIPILYCGLLSSGIAYTLQIISQKFCEPAVASLVMSLESVFAMISACVFYSIVNGSLKLPTGRETVGCALMMVAIFLVETPFADKIFGRLFKKKVKNAN
jgi:drug/metabolite transporter (DMT)-like permease